MMTDDASDLEDESNDPSNLIDMDVFQDLLCTANDNQATFGDSPGTPDDATQRTNPTELEDHTEPDDYTETADPETVTVVIDQFPFGSPGAPISGAPQSSSVYETLQNAHMDAPWAPFSSQLDWEIARWAKMHGLSSTAVTELLKIEGV